METTPFDDQELDTLIRASFEREELLQEVQANVMTHLRRSARRSALRKWARLAAFAVGLPFVLLCFCAGLHYIYIHTTLQPPILVAMALSTTAMLLLAAQAVKDFSFQDV